MAKSPLRTSSWITKIYKVSSAELVNYYKKDSIPVENYLQIEPYTQVQTDSLWEDKLPVGNYVCIRVNGSDVVATILNISNLMVLPVNNKNNLQLFIRNKEGAAVKTTAVFLDGKKIKENVSSGTFYTRSPKKDDDIFVAVYTEKDTLFTTISKSDDLNYSLPQQRRRNYRQTKVYKILNWLPHTFYRLTHKTQKNNKIGASGFVVFNQPKYKPLDTVKFKLYAVNKKWNPITQKIKVYINYYARGKYYNQFLQTLEPSSAGSYNGSFVLADTIPSDISVTINFKNKYDKQILGKSIPVEDYVLDDIGTQEFKADKKVYYKNDSMVFTATAKDANGLNVMDATAKLILTNRNINKFYGDSVYVADTLYVEEKPLHTTAETKFTLPSHFLPTADLELNAVMVFKNSNGELQEKSTLVTYKFVSKEIVVESLGDSLRIVYQEDGVEVEEKGIYSMNDNEDKEMQFPAKIKIDPLAEEYTFELEKVESDIYTEYSIEEDYHVSLNLLNEKDTLGFVLNNPYKIPVFYTVFNGTKIIAEGSGTEALIKWQKIMQDNRQLYKVRWQYYWAGTQHTKEEDIVLLFKTLKIDVTAADKIFPGQKDTLKISITDYKGNPAANVNVTAVSYNNQFASMAKVSDPPYLVKYKSKKFLERDGFEDDELDNEIGVYKYPLGRFRKFSKNFGLDTMNYYKFLLPKFPYTDIVTPISNTIPQLSVNVVKDGKPQEIYLLYINKQLAYYNGVTEASAYAFNVYPENVQLVIRLKDQLIEIDSLYFQPYYKHDVSFDLDRLPPNAKIAKVENFWSWPEMNLLERSLFKMQARGYYDTSFVWQHQQTYKMFGNQNHIVGPFRANENIQFYKPGEFDLNFTFEPEHQYRLSKNMVRLEKYAMFPNKNVKNHLPFRVANLQLFDTLQSPPLIYYKKEIQKPFLIISENESRYANNFERHNVGKLYITKPKDSIINYVVLNRKFNNPIVLNYNGEKYYNIKEGDYDIILVSSKFNSGTSIPVNIKANGTLCYNMEKVNFDSSNYIIDKLLAEAFESTKIKDSLEKAEEILKIALNYLPDSLLFTKEWGGTISGVVRDVKGGNPIPNSSVSFKGFKFGAITDINGRFTIANIRSGAYQLIFANVGYAIKEVEIEIKKSGKVDLDVRLEMSANNMEEVIVVGYGMRTKRSMTASIVTIQNSLNLDGDVALQGRVAGVQITSGTPGVNSNIRLRGANAIDGENKPIYIVDGILYESDPRLSSGSIKEITVLSGVDAVSLYGSRGANGVIVITTDVKISRKAFRDYAFWLPELTTDKNGIATAEVVYPDNATGWKSFVLAMDKKRQVGKTSFFTQSYKPLMAQLALPTFLLEGDKSYVIGKALNYTGDNYFVEKHFSVNGSELSKNTDTLNANASNISSQLIAPQNLDSLLIAFGIKSTTGFKDEESRKIPVFKKGIDETIGNFWILKNDTTVSFQSKHENATVSIYAQNNTLEMLLKQLDFLRDYPYYCMEQIVSKITGLSQEKQIREKLGQPFKDQKMLDKLLSRVQKAQLYDGGWAWWENGKANFQVTNYVTNGLLNYRTNPLVETNIRNAFLYLSNRIPVLSKEERLMALSTLSAGNHQMNYAAATKDYHFDSLTQHQQWQLVKILQAQSLPYDSLLKKLIDKAIFVLPAGVHWGTENYRWYNNSMATTVLAYEVLSKNGKHQNLLTEITQYFLSKTYNGYWRNTVEVASIVKTILPDILKSAENFRSPAQLQVTGDTSFVIKNFPFELKNSSALKNISIKNTGGGMVYLTAYEKFFNKAPEPVLKDLQIKTFFEKDGQVVESINFGEKIKMVIIVEAKKEAEFIFLQVPIPAGCLFSNKTNNEWRMHKEYNKDKLQLFTEFLTKGTHRFEVELEPRYNGTYTINPAKVELMYFPTFYGRNGMKEIEIENN